MLDRRLHKFGTWLGLLAIWLTVLAPTISQTLAAHAARTPVEAMLDIECTAHGSADLTARRIGEHAGHRHDALGHLQACGYCAFFAHLPMVPGFAPTHLPAVAAVPTSYAAVHASLARTERFRVAQPRAPPAVS